MTTGFSHLTRDLVRIAAAAGARIMAHYETDMDVRRKDDKSPVTIADEDAEDLILEELALAAHDTPAISEEASAAGRRPAIGNRFFLVDPLDGTKEFLARNGEFTVNIALIEDRHPVAGVVYAPASRRMWFAAGPGEAFETAVDPHAIDLEAALGRARRIATRPPPKDGLIAVASRTHRDHKTEEYLSHYPVRDFIAAGSSLKFCLIAAGEADIYPRHGTTMEWDTAAGHAVVAAAGGRVVRLDGSPFLYGKVEDEFRNPHFVAWGV